MQKIEDFKIGQKVKDSWEAVWLVKEVLKTRIKIELLQAPEKVQNIEIGKIITYDKPHLQFLTIIQP